LIALSEDELLGLSRKERVDLRLVDPVRVFVKNEPHKIAKLQEGRVRLIMSVSLTDKMIEMLLSRFVCKLEINNWRNIPSKPGIGFTASDSKAVCEDIFNCGLPMSYADVSGWDMSVKDWMIRDEAEGITKLCLDPSPVWVHLLRLKAILESESVYQFSDGEMVAPTFKGIVNSGKLRTSRGNSYMRVRLADLVGSRKTIAAGDDTVENTVENAPSKYLRYGIVVKEYEPVIDSFEFCSHQYKGGTAYALNSEKMVMNLLHQKPTNFLEYKNTMVGFQAELDTHPSYISILKEIDEAGYFVVEGPHYNTEQYGQSQ
jgi:hypothetical protein